MVLGKLQNGLFVVVQSLSWVQIFATPWSAACQISLVLHHLPEFTQIHVPCVGDAIQPSHPLLIYQRAEIDWWSAC